MKGDCVSSSCLTTVPVSQWCCLRVFVETETIGRGWMGHMLGVALVFAEHAWCTYVLVFATRGVVGARFWKRAVGAVGGGTCPGDHFGRHKALVGQRACVLGVGDIIGEFNNQDAWRTQHTMQHEHCNAHSYKPRGQLVKRSKASAFESQSSSLGRRLGCDKMDCVRHAMHLSSWAAN